MKLSSLAATGSCSLLLSTAQAFVLQVATMHYCQCQHQRSSIFRALAGSTALSVTKIITCIDPVNNSTINRRFTTRKTFMEFCEKYKIQSLASANNYSVEGFEDVEDGETYLLVRSETKPSLDFSTLPSPLAAYLPSLPRKPAKYFGGEGYLDVLEQSIYSFLDCSDFESDNFVPPTALVGCSRSGKTRTMKEIAHQIHRSHGHEVAILFVTFNKSTRIDDEEQDDPLQALCQRIAFAASGGPGSEEGEEKESEAFDTFRESYFVDPAALAHWLNGCRVILFIDELNQLEQLTIPSSKGAKQFAKFIKQNFLSRKGQYFVFSSHRLATIRSFTQFVNPLEGSGRTATLWRLPIAESLHDAKCLYPGFHGASEAMFYGLVPGLLHDRSQRNAATENPLQTAAIDCFNRLGTLKKEYWFKQILLSLFTGDRAAIPEQLQTFLIAEADDEGQFVIRWVPCLFKLVLSRMKLAASSDLNHVKDGLIDLTGGLQMLGQDSGKGWESVFGVFLLAHYVGKSPDSHLVPRSWIKLSKGKTEYNEGERLRGELSNMCSLDELLDNFQPHEEPTISVFYPPFNRFPVYDILAFLSVDGIIKECYGFQLNERSPGTLKTPHAQVTKSIMVSGAAKPTSSYEDGWYKPSEAIISAFFGHSGRYWSPQCWKRLNDTYTADVAEDEE